MNVLYEYDAYYRRLIADILREISVVIKNAPDSNIAVAESILHRSNQIVESLPELYKDYKRS